MTGPRTAASSTHPNTPNEIALNTFQSIDYNNFKCVVIGFRFFFYYVQIIYFYYNDAAAVALIFPVFYKRRQNRFGFLFRVDGNS